MDSLDYNIKRTGSMHLRTRKYLSNFFVLFAVLTVGCQSTKKKTEEKQETEKIELLSHSEASNLITTNCYVCHNPSSDSHDSILAPPLKGIKKRYKITSEDRAEFIDRMTDFVSNPTKESALMKGPINRFGLMPKTALSKAEIRAIVTYIHDNDIPAPSWFAEHEREMHDNQ